MTEVVWGSLAKSVDDKITISEEIAAAILAHNNDPSAHSQSNEAIYNHRIGEILDHLADSIKPEHIASDISYINSVVCSADKALNDDTIWQDITGLIMEFNSSKEGKAYFNFMIQSLVQSWDTVARYRLKVIKGAVTTYYPDEGGLELSGAGRSASSHFEQMLFGLDVPLESGDYQVQVQGQNQDDAYTIVVRGLPNYHETYLNMLSVGTLITEA